MWQQHGLAAERAGGSGLRGFLELFARHGNLVQRWEFGPVSAPVRLWRAASSRLNRAASDADLIRRMTRGRCTEEVLAGRHFELLRMPGVRELAVRLGDALTERGGARSGLSRRRSLAL